MKEKSSVINFSLESLNQQQKNAVFSEEKNICVVAGPGCGKTKTLISRIFRIINEKKSEKILVITIVKKAINEIKEKVSNVFGEIPINLKILNIHSFCYEFLKKHFSLLPFLKEKQFSICDNDLQKFFVKQSLDKIDESIDEKNIFQIIKEICFFMSGKHPFKYLFLR